MQALHVLTELRQKASITSLFLISECAFSRSTRLVLSTTPLGYGLCAENAIRTYQFGSPLHLSRYTRRHDFCLLGTNSCFCDSRFILKSYHIEVKHIAASPLMKLDIPLRRSCNCQKVMASNEGL